MFYGRKSPGLEGPRVQNLKWVVVKTNQSWSRVFPQQVQRPTENKGYALGTYWNDDEYFICVTRKSDDGTIIDRRLRPTPRLLTKATNRFAWMSKVRL